MRLRCIFILGPEQWLFLIGIRWNCCVEGHSIRPPFTRAGMNRVIHMCRTMKGSSYCWDDSGEEKISSSSLRSNDGYRSDAKRLDKKVQLRPSPSSAKSLYDSETTNLTISYSVWHARSGTGELQKRLSTVLDSRCCIFFPLQEGVVGRRRLLPRPARPC